jgi:hypothetical protein
VNGVVKGCQLRFWIRAKTMKESHCFSRSGACELLLFGNRSSWRCAVWSPNLQRDFHEEVHNENEYKKLKGAGLFQKALRKALDTYETRCADKIHKPWYLVTLNNFQQFTVELANVWTPQKTLISLFSTHGINKHVMFNEESSAGLTVGKTTCRWCWLTFKLTAP